MCYKGGEIECVVCGGSGSGIDGAYANPITPRSTAPSNDAAKKNVAKLTERVQIQPAELNVHPVPVSDPAGDLRNVPVIAPHHLSVDHNPLHDVQEAVLHAFEHSQFGSESEAK